MFGKYKQSITNKLVSTYTNKKLFKESFHSLMGGLRENKAAREFFVLYGEIENKRFGDVQLAEEYLNAVIKTLKNKKNSLKIPTISEQEVDVSTDNMFSKILKLAKKGLYKEISGMDEIELAKLLENLSDDEMEKLKEMLNDDAKEYIEIILKSGSDIPAPGSLEENKIYSKLDSLIFNESVRAIEKNLHNKRKLVEHLTRPENNIRINETVSTSILSSLVSNKFNKKYESLSEEEKKDLKKYMGINKDSLKEEFNISKKEVMGKLQKLKESNTDKKVLNKLDSVITQIDTQTLDGVSLYKLNKLKEELK